MSEMAPRLVSEAQLAALESELVEQGAVVVEHLRPGLTDEQMDALCAPSGLSLPVEARRWYAWHDGADGTDANFSHSIGGWRPFPLANALAHLAETRRIDAEVRATLPPEHRWDADWKWGAHWLPFAVPAHGAALGLDCGVDAQAPSPVYYVEWSFPVEGPPHPDALSLGALLDDWLERLRSRRWRADPESKTWGWQTAD